MIGDTGDDNLMVCCFSCATVFWSEGLQRHPLFKIFDIFGEIKMYCKLYIHSDTSDAIITTLETQFGYFKKKMSDYTFKEFEAHISVNKESDINKIHIYLDGFLYYKYIVDLEIESENYIQITDSILRSLWENKMPTVVVCDYEDELNDFVLN